MTQDFTRDVDFEIEKEVWNRYDLPSDNVEIRIRAVMIRVQVISDQNDPSKIEYGGETKNITSVIPKQGFNLHGTPTTELILPEKLLSARKVDVDFKTIIEDWNIYRLNDGSRLKMKLVTANISRLLDYYDNHGLPVYSFDSTVVVSTSPRA